MREPEELLALCWLASKVAHRPSQGLDADIHFTFVLEGTMTLIASDQEPRKLKPGDAFVIPPGTASQYMDCSKILSFSRQALDRLLVPP